MIYKFDIRDIAIIIDYCINDCRIIRPVQDSNVDNTNRLPQKD